MIVCIEGLDASGKATQSKRLAVRLGAALFAFPDYETPAGKAILGHLKRHWYVTSGWDETDSGGDPYIRKEPGTDAMVLQSLMTTNRLERGADLRLAAARGHVVLDRYDASAMVYGGLDGLDQAWIAGINAQLPVRPDAYVLLDIPVEESFRRRPERRDRYEQDRAYLERVREGYLALFADRQDAYSRGIRDKQPGRVAPWRVVTGLGTEEEVAERIWNAIGL